MRLHAAVVLFVLCQAASAASPSADPNPPAFTLPDGTALPNPPTSRSFGGGGPLAVPHRPPAPAADADAEQAPVNTPVLTPAERRTRQLDELYQRLAGAKDAEEAGAIGNSIAQVLLRSGSDTADVLMSRALMAMGSKDYSTAQAVLDKVIVLRPRWAEAWNKRATVRFLDNDDIGSMADIGHVLALEPRHFGALSGMGLILHRDGDDKAALVVLRRAAAIDPQDREVKSLVDQLTPVVEGRDL